MAATIAKTPVIVEARLMLGDDTLAYWSAGHVADDAVDFAHGLRVVLSVKDYGPDKVSHGCRVTLVPEKP